MDSSFCYSFPALRGVQAGKEYFVVMCPLRIIPKILLFDEEEVPPQYRAQRIINRARIPEITNYILDNQDDYVFSSITASIDGDLKFVPFNEEASVKDLGLLKIALDSRFLINDGQHRRAAIEEALKTSPELGDETISVVFFHDRELNRSQQIFSDLNRHAVNTTSSIGILYDYRDRLSLVTKDIVFSNELLKRYTDMERVSLSKNSPKLLALNHIYNTNLKLLRLSKGDPISDSDEEFLKEFWNLTCDSINEWQLVLNKEISPRDIRLEYIVGHGIFIESLGLLGYYLRNNKTNWKKYVKMLGVIDWSRSNTDAWEGRAFNNAGRIQKTSQTIKLTTIKIKELLNLPLSTDEIEMEEKSFRRALK